MSSSAAVLGDSGRSLAAADGEAARDPLSISAEVKASLSLLIVDDDRTLREGCASVLQMDGFNVTTLGRGDEALELVRRRLGPPGAAGRVADIAAQLIGK